MKYGAAYCRMSTDKQEYSIESQIRLIKQYSKKNNIVIIEIYNDKGISGRQAEKRPAFMKMIEDSYTGKFDCVLIYDSSRFARNLEQSIVYKSILKKNNVELISITEPFFDEDNSLISDALFGAMNEIYSRKLSKNVKRGMEQTALRGSFFSAPPFGYKRIQSHKPIIINPEDAKIVKYIYNEYLNGKSIFMLAKELNQMNIKTRFGNPMQTRTIKYILTNPTYKGYLKWSCDGKTYYFKADHEAIIEENIFEAVQEKFKTSSNTYKSRPPETRKHWLSGLIKCSACNSGYVFSKGYKGRKDRFRCSGYLKGLCSAASSITVDKLSSMVISELNKIIGNNKNIYICDMEYNTQNIKNYNRQLKKLNTSLFLAKKAYLSNTDTLNEYNENKQNILNEIEYIQNLKSEIENDNYLKSQILNSSDILTGNYNYIKKYNLARKCIEKIIIDNNTKKIKIYFWG